MMSMNTEGDVKFSTQNAAVLKVFFGKCYFLCSISHQHLNQHNYTSILFSCKASKKKPTVPGVKKFILWRKPSRNPRSLQPFPIWLEGLLQSVSLAFYCYCFIYLLLIFLRTTGFFLFRETGDKELRSLGKSKLRYYPIHLNIILCVRFLLFSQIKEPAPA